MTAAASAPDCVRSPLKRQASKKAAKCDPLQSAQGERAHAYAYAPGLDTGEEEEGDLDEELSGGAQIEHACDLKLQAAIDRVLRENMLDSSLRAFVMEAAREATEGFSAAYAPPGPDRLAGELHDCVRVKCVHGAKQWTLVDGPVLRATLLRGPPEGPTCGPAPRVVLVAADFSFHPPAAQAQAALAKEPPPDPEWIIRVVAALARLRPAALLFEAGAPRGLPRAAAEACPGALVATSVHSGALRRVARCSGAVLIRSLEGATEAAVGTCRACGVVPGDGPAAPAASSPQTPPSETPPRRSPALRALYFAGGLRAAGCTLLLRALPESAPRLKRALRAAVLEAHSSRLERALLSALAARFPPASLFPDAPLSDDDERPPPARPAALKPPAHQRASSGDLRDFEAAVGLPAALPARAASSGAGPSAADARPAPSFRVRYASYCPERGRDDYCCVAPEARAFPLYTYGEGCDVPLGAFLAECCFDPAWRCPAACGHAVSSHVRTFLHGRGALRLFVEQGPNGDAASGPPPVAAGVEAWSVCRECTAGPPIPAARRRLPPAALGISLGHLLSLVFHSPATAGCPHSLFRARVLFFAPAGAGRPAPVARLEFFPAAPFRILLAPGPPAEPAEPAAAERELAAVREAASRLACDVRLRLAAAEAAEGPATALAARLRESLDADRAAFRRSLDAAERALQRGPAGGEVALALLDAARMALAEGVARWHRALAALEEGGAGLEERPESRPPCPEPACGPSTADCGPRVLRPVPAAPGLDPLADFPDDPSPDPPPASPPHSPPTEPPPPPPEPEPRLDALLGEPRLREGGARGLPGALPAVERLAGLRAEGALEPADPAPVVAHALLSLALRDRVRRLRPAGGAPPEEELAPPAAGAACHVLHAFVDAADAEHTVTALYARQFAAARALFHGGGERAFLASLAAPSEPWAAPGGKSGARFRRTRDGRLLLKPLLPAEAEAEPLARFADAYFARLRRVAAGEPTALVKVLGIFEVSWRAAGGRGGRAHYAVMPNLLHGRPAARLYDLKGAAGPRAARDGAALLDEDLRRAMFEGLGGLPVREAALEQLAAALAGDAAALAAAGVMDYSLLVAADEERRRYAVGLVDYLRQWDIVKRLETLVKAPAAAFVAARPASPLAGGPAEGGPTVVSPQLYAARLTQAVVGRYFAGVPDGRGPPLPRPPTRPASAGPAALARPAPFLAEP